MSGVTVTSEYHSGYVVEGLLSLHAWVDVIRRLLFSFQSGSYSQVINDSINPDAVYH